MEAELDQLESLSLRPKRLAKELKAAREALRRTYPQATAAKRALDAASLLADATVSITSKGRYLIATWLVCFVFLRLLASSAELPAGPWLNWGVLLGFERDSLFLASLLLVALVVLPVLACRSIGKLVYRALSPSGVRFPVVRPAWCALALVAIATAVLMSCSDRGHSTIATSECAEARAWQPQAIGQAWWSLLCPIGVRDGSCAIDLGERHEAFAPGQRVIVAADQLRRVDFVPGSSRCATRIRLAEESAAPGSAASTSIRIDRTVEQPPPDVRELAQKVELSLAPDLIEGLKPLADALAQWPRKLPKKLDLNVDVSGMVTTQWAKDSVTTINWPKLEDSLGSLAPFIGSIVKSMDIAQKTLDLRKTCELKRRASSTGQRIGYLLSGDKECLDAIGKN